MTSRITSYNVCYTKLLRTSELAENILSPRIERVPGVAAVTVGGGLRRQIHVDLSREKTTALDLSVDRIVAVLRNENQNT